MNHFYCPYKITLRMLLFAILTITTCSVDDFITFGSESNTSGKGKASGPNAEAITFTENKNSFNLSVPNVWSGFVQYEMVNINLPQNAAPKGFLTIETKGQTSGSTPKLRVLLFSSQWKNRSVWEFDLKNLKPDEYTSIPATTALDSPLEVSQDGPISLIGIIQILTLGKNNQAWSLDIKGLEFSSPKPQ